jgi:hypothetical protein
LLGKDNQDKAGGAGLQSRIARLDSEDGTARKDGKD